MSFPLAYPEEMPKFQFDSSTTLDRTIQVRVSVNSGDVSAALIQYKSETKSPLCSLGWKMSEKSLLTRDNSVYHFEDMCWWVPHGAGAS